MANIEKKVQNGVDLLDEWFKGMADWRGRINLDHLDLGDPYSCVLGQLFSSYMNGVDVLAPDSVVTGTKESFQWGVEHGFDADEDDVRPGQRRDPEVAYENLKVEWKARLGG